MKPPPKQFTIQVKKSKEHIIVDTICNHLFIKGKKKEHIKPNFLHKKMVTPVASGNVCWVAGRQG